MGYVFLGLAIVGEVIATTFLKFTSGEKAVWWAYAIVGVGYVFAFGMLSLALGRGVPLGTAYAIWAGVGVVLVAVTSTIPSTCCQVSGGVVLLEAGGKHSA